MNNLSERVNNKYSPSLMKRAAHEGASKILTEGRWTTLVLSAAGMTIEGTQKDACLNGKLDAHINVMCET